MTDESSNLVCKLQARPPDSLNDHLHSPECRPSEDSPSTDVSGGKDIMTPRIALW